MLPALLLAAARHRTPALRLSPLFADGAVLQRGQELPIFGTARPGASVSLSLAGQSASAVTDPSGRWIVRLKPISGPGPYVLTVDADGQTVSARDLLAGEVWIASGQSNMEMPESAADDYAQARTEARPDVRMFTVEKIAAGEPQTEVKGRWEASTADTVGHFSAVGLAFARELNRKLGVPVGIVHASWGGTPAEAWTSREALLANPTLKPLVDAYDAAQKDYPTAMAVYKQAVSDFVNFKHMGGNEGFMHDWQATEFDDAKWDAVPAGTLLPDTFDGAAWYRKTVDIPADWLGKALTLDLGRVDDYDTTYFNGIRVGRTGVEDDNGDAGTPRHYRVAPGVVRAGRNVIAVRVFDVAGPGGLTGPVPEMRLARADGGGEIPLDGEWRLKLERALDPKTQIPQHPVGPSNPFVSTTLANGMVAPLAGLAIRGAIWYQGEANVGRAEQYRDLFPALIRDWRSRWKEGDFPFLFVQLPNFGARTSDLGWAEIRGAQAEALALPNTGMAVTIDLGAADTVHPTAKREVGRRLALQALGRVYRRPVVYEGPSFASMKVVGDAIRVEFDHGALFTTDNKPPRGFEIRAVAGPWVAAEATMDGSTVTLRAASLGTPVAVRYAWRDNPDVNLVNRQGLPAAPFRTGGG